MDFVGAGLTKNQEKNDRFPKPAPFDSAQGALFL